MTERGYEFVVQLPDDRSTYGTIKLIDTSGNLIVGPFDVLAMADQKAAEENGNRERNPRKRFGHTPTGTFSVLAIVRPSDQLPLFRRRSRSGLLTYGLEGLIVVIPTGGPALDAAAQGRSEFWIQAGDMADGRLRPTHGALRVPPGALASLIAGTDLFEQAGICRIMNIPDGPTSERGAAYTDDRAADPPPSFLRSALASRSTSDGTTLEETDDVDEDDGEGEDAFDLEIEAHEEEMEDRDQDADGEDY